MAKLRVESESARADEAIEPVPVEIVVPRGFWQREAEHFPQPVTASDRTVFFALAERAVRRWMDEFGLLMERIDFGEIGGWHYVRMVPFGGKDRPAPPAWLMPLLVRLVPSIRRRLRDCVEAVRSRKAEGFVDRWYDEWLPMLEGRLEGLREANLEGFSDEELEAHALSLREFLAECVEIHSLLHGSEMIVIADFAFTCRDVLGWDEGKAFEMLAGLSYKSTEPAHRLAELAQMARERPAVAQLLAAVDETTTGRLADVDPEFAAALAAYQRQYACRTIGYGAADLSMAETPELTLNLIQHQIEQEYDPAAEAGDLARRRAQTIAEARSLLDGRQDAERERFEGVLAAAQRAYPVREDNEFFTISAPCAFLRYLMLEQGRRLAERGQIGRRDDVFFLDFEDTLAVLRNGESRHDLVRRRKGERLWSLQHPGPPSYGKEPGPAPSFKAFPPEARFAHEALMWVIDRMGMPALEKGEINAAKGGMSIEGIPASAGRYTGPVRVIMDESQFGKLQAGDVLVCPVTSPVWSVLFPSVGALVTDTGGILSHPAIIAREYVIPAVVSTGNATQLLRDGQLVTVDGTAGTVEVAGG